jgi:hypothetical protein
MKILVTGYDRNYLIYLNFFSFIVCWVWVHCFICTGCCNVSNVSCLNSPPPQLFFIFPSPNTRIVVTVLFLHLLYMCTHFCTIFTLLPPFPTTSPLPLAPTLTPDRTSSAHLFSDLWKNKRKKIKRKT